MSSLGLKVGPKSNAMHYGTLDCVRKTAIPYRNSCSFSKLLPQSVGHLLDTKAMGAHPSISSPSPSE